MFKLTDDRSKKGRELRMSIVETIQELMKSDDTIVALDADLAEPSGFCKIKKSNPERFIQCGISEANMVGVSAGLSVMGFKPFLHSFGPFVTRRVYDQLYISGAYAHTTLHIYGSDPGFTVAQNGGTHTTWEDMALVRAIPNSVICDAADDTQLSWIIKEFAKMEGIHYVRANRKAVRNVYEAGSSFEIGKGNVIKAGTDVLIVVAGQLVSDALDAGDLLDKKGISAEIIDMFTVKPLDKELLLKEAVGKQAIVTFENHSITGGLGSAVAETIAEANVGIKFKRHGVDERFGQVGTAEFLQKEYQLTAEDLVKTVEVRYER